MQNKTYSIPLVILLVVAVGFVLLAGALQKNSQDKERTVVAPSEHGKTEAKAGTVYFLGTVVRFEEDRNALIVTALDNQSDVKVLLGENTQFIKAIGLNWENALPSDVQAGSSVSVKSKTPIQQRSVIDDAEQIIIVD